MPVTVECCACSSTRPEGTVEQLVIFDRPDTITDDINPLDYLYNGTATVSERDD